MQTNSQSRFKNDKNGVSLNFLLFPTPLISLQSCLTFFFPKQNETRFIEIIKKNPEYFSLCSQRNIHNFFWRIVDRTRWKIAMHYGASR